MQIGKAEVLVSLTSREVTCFCIGLINLIHIVIVDIRTTYNVYILYQLCK